MLFSHSTSLSSYVAWKCLTSASFKCCRRSCEMWCPSCTAAARQKQTLSASSSANYSHSSTTGQSALTGSVSALAILLSASDSKATTKSHLKTCKRWSRTSERGLHSNWCSALMVLRIWIWRHAVVCWFSIGSQWCFQTRSCVLNLSKRSSRKRSLTAKAMLSKIYGRWLLGTMRISRKRWPNSLKASSGCRKKKRRANSKQKTRKIMKSARKSRTSAKLCKRNHKHLHSQAAEIMKTSSKSSQLAPSKISQK